MGLDWDDPSAERSSRTGLIADGSEPVYALPRAHRRTTGHSRSDDPEVRVAAAAVLDVNGQRLVVDATYSPDTTKADRAALQRVVDSLGFDAP